MEGTQENQLRLLALCQRMGDLWTGDDITELNAHIPARDKQADEYLLYGKLFSKPNANFQAFWETMKKAWKVDEVRCEVIQQGFFAFSFKSAVDQRRILQTSPWSFSSNLLVLQEGDPTVPEHCYEFNHCSFWVHLMGLPRAALVEECIRMIAGKMGEVEEVRIDARTNGSRKIGKAKVRLNLLHPLKTGTIIHVGDRNWWIDFKYERLPHFCYSCGYIGHYANYCPTIPYENSGLPQDKPGRYGSWLKAEVKNSSPCWDTFYGEIDLTLTEDEMVPETPVIPSNEESNRKSSSEGGQALVIYNPATQLISEVSVMDEYAAQKRGKRIQQSSEQPKGRSMQEIRVVKSGSKQQPPKKLKRFAPYEKRVSLTTLDDMDQLLDTPIQIWEGESAGALVASPNKPPRKP